MTEPPTASGVVAGARPRTAPAVVGLVLGAFVVVELVLLGLGLLVLAAAFVIAENVLIRHAMNDEAADLPESQESQSPGAWRVPRREPGHASDGARTH